MIMSGVIEDVKSFTIVAETDKKGPSRYEIAMSITAQPADETREEYTAENGQKRIRIIG